MIKQLQLKVYTDTFIVFFFYVLEDSQTAFLKIDEHLR